MTRPEDQPPETMDEGAAPTFVFPDAIDRHNITIKLVNKLHDIDPSVMSVIETGVGKLNDVDPRGGPLRMFDRDVTLRIILERATEGIAPTLDEVREIKRVTHPSTSFHVFSQINATLNDILAASGNDPESLDDDEIARLVDNPANASRLAKAIAEHELVETDLDESTFIFRVQQCYLATILSGNKSTYRKVHTQSHRIAVQMRQTNLEYPTIERYVAHRADKLPELADVFESDAPRFFSEYAKLSALRDLVTLTNLDKVGTTVTTFREEMLRYIDEVIWNPDVTRGLAIAYNRPDILKDRDASQMNEIDWEILPPGKLAEHAKDIVDSYTSETKKPTIDLERLTILEEIRRWWGEDKSYYRKGIRKGRRVIREDGKEQPDEYILLILQHFDEDGNVTHEDAIAESPIAGPNALYIQRYDVNHWSWDELMQYPKGDVLAMGARAIKHETAEGHNIYQMMTEKVKSALGLSPENFLAFEFSGVDKQGGVRIRIPKRVLEFVIADVGAESIQRDHQDRRGADDGDL
jgi:hypothetical protein